MLPSLAAAAKISLAPWKLNLDGLNLWSDLVNSKTETFSLNEREILHMLDDVFSVKSFLKGQFKYIKGTTIQGLYDHVLLQRNLKIKDPRDLNYAEIIKNSIVSQALDKFNEKPLKSAKIRNLRIQSQVKCGEIGSSCNPLKEECLFDIFQDPCEQNNLVNHPQYQY